MRVKVIACIASEYSTSPDQVSDVPEEVANDWIQAGYAEPVQDDGEAKKAAKKTK